MVSVVCIFCILKGSAATAKESFYFICYNPFNRKN